MGPDCEELSDEGAIRLINASKSVDINNLTSLDSEEDLEKFIKDTD